VKEISTFTKASDEGSRYGEVCYDTKNLALESPFHSIPAVDLWLSEYVLIC
jgi:hypothetical protein